MKVVLGLVAGALTSSAWLPQLIRIFRHQRADDIAWGYLFVIATGIFLWIGYGIVTHAASVIIANCFSELFVSTVIVMKYQLALRKRQPQEL